MKLQAAVDKLFSHKMFSNKYFLYAVVAASVLTNYMRIVDCHYEVVGFFILVGIIMMNFSKNIAVVLTVCLLLTQIIMAGKAVQEGFNPNKKFKNDLKNYMTPEQLTQFNAHKKTYEDAKKTLVNLNKQLTDVNKIITDATAAKNAAQTNIATNNAAKKIEREQIKNAMSKNKQKLVSKNTSQLDKLIAVSTTYNDTLNSAEATIKTSNDTKLTIEQNIATAIATQTTAKNDMDAIKVAAENTKDAEKAAKKAAKQAAKAANDKRAAEAAAAAKKAADDKRAAEAAAAATAAATAAKKAADAIAARTAKQFNKMQNSKSTKPKVTVLNAVAKVSAAKAANVRKRLRIGKNNFALLNEEDDDDMEYDNEFDFMGPSDISGLTQGTTNLMTKQKDLFSFMNSMTPLIDNAKKMLSGLDLSKLQA